jgi:hypothetical protein
MSSQQMAKNVDMATRTVELLRTLTIVQLGLAGVGQAQIRKIVGGSMNDINAIVKLLRSGKRGKQSNG